MPESNGQVLLGGLNGGYNGQILMSDINNSHGVVVRINADGTRDAGFASETFNSVITALQKQSDDKILVAGYFTGPANSIVRLNRDGTRDSTFSSPSSSANIQTMIVLPDNKIVVGGFFTSYDGTSAGRIVQLNANGTLDQAFNNFNGSGANDTINVIARQSDGKIILAGAFSSFNGTSVVRICRLNTNGSFDNTFNTTSGPNSAISHMVVDSSNNIFIFGLFNQFGGTSRFGMAKLNPNGFLDTDWVPVSGFGVASISSALIEQDGSIIVCGGDLTVYDGTAVQNMMKLLPNARLDVNFKSNISRFSEPSRITRMARYETSKAIITGGFNVYNGVVRNGIARIFL